MPIASLSTRHARVLLVAALALTTYLALTPLDTPILEDINDKLQHILAFVVLAWLTDEAFPTRSWSRHKCIPLFAYGLIIELLQGAVPGRVTSLLDLGADTLGLLLYPLLRSLAARLGSTKHSDTNQSP